MSEARDGELFPSGPWCGFREGKSIWGTWSCFRLGCAGVFRIWPGTWDGTEEGLEAEESLPVPADGVLV